MKFPERPPSRKSKWPLPQVKDTAFEFHPGVWLDAARGDPEAKARLDKLIPTSNVPPAMGKDGEKYPLPASPGEVQAHVLPSRKKLSASEWEDDFSAVGRGGD